MLLPQCLLVLALAHVLLLAKLGHFELRPLCLCELLQRLLLGLQARILHLLEGAVSFGVVHALGDRLLVRILEVDGERLGDGAGARLAQVERLHLGGLDLLLLPLLGRNVVGLLGGGELAKALDDLRHFGDVADEARDQLVLHELLIEDAAPLLLHPLVERLGVEDEGEPHEHLLVVLREDKLAENGHAHVLEPDDGEVAEHHV